MGEEKKLKGKNVLQRRIIIVVVSFIIVIFAIVVGAALNIIGTHLLQESDSRYQVVADNVAQEITTWFSNEAQIVLSQKAAIEINGEFYPDFLTEYLTRIVEDYNEEGYIYDLYFVNTDNVMSSGYGYIPDASIDFRKRVWYVNALESGGLFYSVPYKDSNLDRYVVTLSIPCSKPDGKLAGVLALDIFVDTLFSIAEDKVIDGSSYVFLIDNNMGLATHPNPEYAYVNDEPVATGDLPENKYSYIVDYIEGRLDESDYNSHYNIVDYDGVDRAIYVSKIDCCGWYAVAAIESSVFISPLVKTLLIVVGMLIICLVVGILSTRIVTGKVIRQLNKANEAALMANETKGQFLANMSHEIRTPINAIIGMNEMVIRENDNPSINEYAHDIASASRSLVSIVNDILDFSKIESGKMEIVENEFNIGSIVNDIVNMSEARLGNKNLDLFFRVDPRIPAGLMGDEMRIKQIILNMMTNAIKYTNTGFVTMRVEFTKQEYGINLDVFVKDSGIGIAEENLENLYESFQRFDSKRNRSIEGTGLGLSITKRLVQAMGGYINVNSKLGEGSEFSVTIPLKVANWEPFMSLEEAARIHMVTCFDMSNVTSRMHEEAMLLVEEIGTGLNIDIFEVPDMAALKSTLENRKITHIATDQKLYQDNIALFDELAKEKTVMVVQKKNNPIMLSAGIIGLAYPLYSMSIVAALKDKKNTEYAKSNLNFTFSAPTAKILIVDDNSMNLKVAAGLLKPYGMKVITVDSGEKAIELLKESRDFDIVFMDHMMPIMDGIEATAIIRKLGDEYYRQLPIMALTANTINNAKAMFLNSGFNDFVAKPININSLDRVLKEYLPKEKMRVNTEGGREAGNVKSADVGTPDMTKTATGDTAEESVIDVKLGLKYTANDMELYLDILKDYTANADETKNLLNDALEKQDWKNYIIKVHSLKSISLSIGAAKLSALAKELELSGKAGNTDVIVEKHSQLLAQYNVVVEAGRSILADNNIFADKNMGANDLSPVKSDALDKELLIPIAEAVKKAVSEFDSAKVEELIEQAGEKGQEYKDCFNRVLELVNDFEYQKAEDEIGKIIAYENDTDN